MQDEEVEVEARTAVEAETMATEEAMGEAEAAAAVVEAVTETSTAVGMAGEEVGEAVVATVVAAEERISGLLVSGGGVRHRRMEDKAMGAAMAMGEAEEGGVVDRTETIAALSSEVGRSDEKVLKRGVWREHQFWLDEVTESPGCYVGRSRNQQDQQEARDKSSKSTTSPEC